MKPIVKILGTIVAIALLFLFITALGVFCPGALIVVIIFGAVCSIMKYKKKLDKAHEEEKNKRV
jgi:hypothetical protein